MKEKEKDVLQLERSVRRLEAIVAAEAKVKEETEQKVVEEKALGAGQWLSGFLGTREAWAIEDLPWDPSWLAPTPKT